MKKIILISLTMLCVLSGFNSGIAETSRVFLRNQGTYTDIQKIQIELACLRIEMEEKERLKDFQLYQMAQEVNKALNWSNPLDRPHVDLSQLDVFNYSLNSIAFDIDNQQVVVSVLANQNFVDQKPSAEQRRFLADSFRLASQKLAHHFLDYDEYRDLIVNYYTMDFPDEPFAVYKEGGFTWAPRK
ncbi:MAG: hypothetical protein L0Y74_04285 [candidate division Zixibacteria bacterium]|nr:hypothetical protein [candidate division Zixibacteria bacterium]